MLKVQSVPTIETAAGIPVNLDITSTASGIIMRDGREIDQSFRRPHTADLVVGARLLHTTDCRLYEIVGWMDPLFTIKRLTDETIHAATLRQLKQHTFLCTEQRIEGTG